MKPELPETPKCPSCKRELVNGKVGLCYSCTSKFTSPPTTKRKLRGVHYVTFPPITKR